MPTLLLFGALSSLVVATYVILILYPMGPAPPTFGFKNFRALHPTTTEYGGRRGAAHNRSYTYLNTIAQPQRQQHEQEMTRIESNGHVEHERKAIRKRRQCMNETRREHGGQERKAKRTKTTNNIALLATVRA